MCKFGLKLVRKAAHMYFPSNSFFPKSARIRTPPNRVIGQKNINNVQECFSVSTPTVFSRVLHFGLMHKDIHYETPKIGGRPKISSYNRLA